jgi:cytochrome c556
MKPTRLIGLVVAMSVVATLSFAQSDPIQIVKKRQEDMKSFSSTYMRGIFELRKDGTGDLGNIAIKAREASDAFKTIPSLFPAGTDRAAFQETRASPEIWSKRAEFETYVAKLVAETTKLADLAASGKREDARAQSSVVIEACFSCHGGPSKSGGKFRFEAS